MLALGYPVFVYLGIRHGISWIFPLVASFLFVRMFRAGGRHAWLFGLVALALLAGAVFFQHFSAKMIPVLVHTSMFILFYSSLRKGQSLIERFARLDFPELPPEIATYCRKVTWVWTIFFAVNIVWCSALAIWADAAFWALYNGAIIYLLIGLLMISEYIWRRLRYPWLEIPPFKQSMMNIMKNGHTIWGGPGIWGDKG